MFEIRWEFEIRPECHAEFAEAYGPEGAWVRLFRLGAGYLGTDAREVSPNRWETVDRWESRVAHDAFRVAHAVAYAELDAKCAHFTLAERKIDERGG